MKNLKITALAFAGVLTLVSAFGCGEKKVVERASDTQSEASVSHVDSNNTADSNAVPDSDPIDLENIGSIEHRANLSDEIDANETSFKLNSVIDPGVIENGQKFIFFDITINNPTDTAYSLSTLNNFFIRLPDGTDIYSDIRTQLYALNAFKENSYSKDPFEIPAKGQFSGVIGGFLLDEGVTEFTVGFFPTKDAVNDKEEVILIDITPDMIANADALLK